jgi:hypothetical protein
MLLRTQERTHAAPLQAEAAGLSRLPGFGAATRLGLARGCQDRLLRALVRAGVMVEETQRQEAYASIVAVLRLQQVLCVHTLRMALCASCCN